MKWCVDHVISDQSALAKSDLSWWLWMRLQLICNQNITTHTHTHTHACTITHNHTHTHAHIITRTHTHTHTHTHMHVQSHTHTHTHMHVQSHVYTHTHTHTHTIQSWAYRDLGSKKWVAVFQTKRWTILANAPVATQVWVCCVLQWNLHLSWLYHTLPFLCCALPWCGKNSFSSFISLFQTPLSFLSCKSTRGPSSSSWVGPTSCVLASPRQVHGWTLLSLRTPSSYPQVHWHNLSYHNEDGDTANW